MNLPNCQNSTCQKPRVSCQQFNSKSVTSLSLSDVRRYGLFWSLFFILADLSSKLDSELRSFLLFLFLLTDSSVELFSQLDSEVSNLLWYFSLFWLLISSELESDFWTTFLFLTVFLFLFFFFSLCSAISSIEGSCMTGISVSSQQKESWKNSNYENNNTRLDVQKKHLLVRDEIGREIVKYTGFGIENRKNVKGQLKVAAAKYVGQVHTNL